jgi:hypothetical protein
MDQELTRIVEHLIERNKHKVLFNHLPLKIYFIMRYPDKPKLVYAPIDFGIELNAVPKALLPGLIAHQWAERRANGIQGVDLIAVCTIGTYIYISPGLIGMFNSLIK